MSVMGAGEAEVKPTSLTANRADLFGWRQGTDDADSLTTSFTETEGGRQYEKKVVKELSFKVVVVGDYSVGKTTFCKRLLAARFNGLPLNSNQFVDDGEFSPSSANCDSPDHWSEPGGDERRRVVPTVGTDFFSRVLNDVLPHISLRLQIWDTAGLERYAAVPASIYRHASLVVCLFDVTGRESLRDVAERHLATAAQHIPDAQQESILVVANKIDLMTDSPPCGQCPKLQSSQSGAGALRYDESTDAGSVTVDPVSTSLSHAVVTQQDVQELLFNAFPEVRFAEVSAWTGQGMSQVLGAICHALLANSGVIDEAGERTSAMNRMMQRSALPSRVVGLSSDHAVPKSVDLGGCATGAGKASEKRPHEKQAACNDTLIHNSTDGSNPVGETRVARETRERDEMAAFLSRPGGLAAASSSGSEDRSRPPQLLLGRSSEANPTVGTPRTGTHSDVGGVDRGSEGPQNPTWENSAALKQRLEERFAAIEAEAREAHGQGKSGKAKRADLKDVKAGKSGRSKSSGCKC